MDTENKNPLAYKKNVHSKPITNFKLYDDFIQRGNLLLTKFIRKNVDTNFHMFIFYNDIVKLQSF